MKIFVWGIGGREHALINSLRKNAKHTVYALDKNGEIYGDIKYVRVQNYTVEEIVNFLVSEGIDLVVVGSEELLVAGIADKLAQKNILCFGPNLKALQLEGSKAFAKEFMQKYNIPTAPFCIFNYADTAKEYLLKAQYPLVIKADGLAKGKGVFVVDSIDEAFKTVDDLMTRRIFGASGNSIVVEKFLIGQELSVFALCDGEYYVILPSAMDYKKVGDGNVGKNTGGMGAISPNPYFTENLKKQCEEQIVVPTLRGLKQEGIFYVGCLYFGLILTEDGIKVLEYNCRFGDPETQAVLPLIQNDLASLLLATVKGRLDCVEMSFCAKASCCVVVADGNYPDYSVAGQSIDLNPCADDGDVNVLLANVKRVDGKYVTDGGRILNVVAIADTLEKARNLCYNYLYSSNFKSFRFRKDIGKV